MEHTCSHPTCYESDKTVTMYKEETPHNDRGWFPVCGKHVSEPKARAGKVTVLMPELADGETLEEANRAAAELSAEVLKGLQAKKR